MKLFPALFYIACIILLGARLRPLHHSSSSVTTVLWWQRELDLWVGWTYRLLTAFITRLHKPSPGSLPLTILDAGQSHLPFWRIDGQIKCIGSRCSDLAGSLYTSLTAVMDWVQTFIAVQVGDQMRGLMRNVLAACRAESNPLFEFPGPGSIASLTELEELGGLTGPSINTVYV